jgi:hypothetical protein
MANRKNPGDQGDRKTGKGKNGTSIFCPPILQFIPDRVAAWQSSRNAERNSESINDLISVGHFANRSKAGKGQWLPAGDY